MKVVISFFSVYVRCVPQGDYFERSSLLSGLLSVSVLIAKFNPLILAVDKYSCFRSMRNFPEVTKVDAENCFVSGPAIASSLGSPPGPLSLCDN